MSAPVVAADPMAVLESVRDPEIPEISVVDLGIVREVSTEGGSCSVTITPTYSGCPAYAVIEEEIREAMEGAGFGKTEVRRRLSPPWTTDWMSDKGRETLRSIGIAPPAAGAGGLDGVVHVYSREAPCPRCGADATRLVSEFGATSCKSIRFCPKCLEPFEHFKEA